MVLINGIFGKRHNLHLLGKEHAKMMMIMMSLRPIFYLKMLNFAEITQVDNWLDAYISSIKCSLLYLKVSILKSNFSTIFQSNMH